MTNRIDPIGCGCTDCLTGWSVPLDRATQSDLWQMLAGQASNATSFPLTDFTVTMTDTAAVIASPAP